MKYLAYFIMMAFFLNLETVSANEFYNTEPVKTKALTSQIHTLLGEEMIPNEIRGQKAEVRLAVDYKGTVRVLSITSENEILSDYIKEHIDFQEVRKGTYEEGVIYRIPIEVAK